MKKRTTGAVQAPWVTRITGGAGLDTFTGTFGKDTVIDSDGAGKIQIDGATLNGGAAVSKGVWLSAGLAL